MGYKVNRKFLVATTCILTIITIWVTLFHVNWFTQIQKVVLDTGEWGYVIFVLAYTIATLMILPVTALNIAGGAIYGGIQGLFLTSFGALLSAIIAFALARCFGDKFIRINERWSKVSKHLVAGGLTYAFAARLLPIIPYGVVSFAAGLSPIKQRDYLLGTLFGTPLGIAPFVFLGSTGVKVLSIHDVFPFLLSSMAIAVLVGVATWYRQHLKSLVISNQLKNKN